LALGALPFLVVASVPVGCGSDHRRAGAAKLTEAVGGKRASKLLKDACVTKEAVEQEIESGGG
jgi:hypothetical protein